MSQYLDNVRPLVTEAVYTQTKQRVEKFSQKDGVGEKVRNISDLRKLMNPEWIEKVSFRVSSTYLFSNDAQVVKIIL